MRDANRREFGRQTFPRARARRLIDDRSQSKPRDARDEDAVAADEGRAGGGAVESERRRRRVRPSIAGAETARGNPTAADGSAAPTAAETCAAWAEMCAPPGTSARAAEVNARSNAAASAVAVDSSGTLVDGAHPLSTAASRLLASVAAHRTPSGAMVTASRSGVVAAAASAANVAPRFAIVDAVIVVGSPVSAAAAHSVIVTPGVVLAVASLASRIARATSAWCSAIGSKPAQSGTTTPGVVAAYLSAYAFATCAARARSFVAVAGRSKTSRYSKASATSYADADADADAVRSRLLRAGGGGTVPELRVPVYGGGCGDGGGGGEGAGAGATVTVASAKVAAPSASATRARITRVPEGSHASTALDEVVGPSGASDPSAPTS